MPPAGSYILYNPAYSTFAGIADDNTTVVGYTSLDKAQVWVHGSDNRIGTTLRNGQTKYITYTGSDATITDTGFVWSYANISANMWKIDYPGYTTYPIFATNVGGAPQNAKISCTSLSSPGTNSHWLFLPFSGSQGPRVWNQVVGPEDLFSTSTQTLNAIVGDMLVAFRENLNKDKNPSSMIPTHVTRTPRGTETGSFLALTLTDKLTVSYFELDGASDVSTSQQKSYSLTPSQLGGSAADLFKYIAECVKKAVVDSWNLPSTEHDPLLMGMTVAFPVEKTTLDSGKLLRWTKEVTDNVTSGGTIGLDIVEELQKALDNIDGLHIRCNTLLNDTTATLLAQAYESGGCSIAAIFDSGTNGAYVEAAAKVKSLNETDGEMVLNTEWGCFGNVTNLQRTQFDYQIDRESAHPGDQIFEKLVSSISVGELLRLVLLHYIDNGISPSPTPHRPLFNRRSSGKLNTKGSITIDLVWEIDAAKTDGAVQQLLVKKFGLLQGDVTEEDGKRVKEICRAILLRTARLSACALASILILMERAQIGGGIELGARIGLSGSLTRPTFRRDMEDALREIIGANATKNVLIALVKRDRTNLGAAVCACLASTNGSD